MIQLIVIIASMLFGALPLQQPPSTEPVAARGDSERALIAALESVDSILPHSRGMLQEPDTLAVSVRMLGQCQTAEGPRKIAVVQFRTETPAGESAVTSVANFVLYFSPGMNLLDHHYQGCGTGLRLEGSVMHFGQRTFDLSTREGLAGFKATQNWC